MRAILTALVLVLSAVPAMAERADDGGGYGSYSGQSEGKEAHDVGEFMNSISEQQDFWNEVGERMGIFGGSPGDSSASHTGCGCSPDRSDGQGDAAGF